MAGSYDLSRIRPWSHGRHPRPHVRPTKEPMPFGRIIEPERLIATWERFAERDSAPGRDGVRFRDVPAREYCRLLRETAEEIRSRGYFPWVRRTFQVPKANGGVRTIAARPVVNRVVSARMKDGIESYFESLFRPWSYGFRPGRSTWDALATLDRGVREGLAVFAQADIVNAFPSLPLGRLIEIFAAHLEDRRTFELVESILLGYEDRDRERGIDTGDPLSPLALNVFCDEVFDRRFASVDVPVRARYADNVGGLTKTVPEGETALAEAADLFAEAELELKCDQAADLRDPAADVTFLGFRLSADGTRLKLSIPERAWGGLGGWLSDVREVEDQPYRAHAATKGWVEAYAPAFQESEMRRLCDRVRETARKAGFRELSAGCVERWARRARRRWDRLLSLSTQSLPTRRRVVKAPPAADIGCGM